MTILRVLTSEQENKELAKKGVKLDSSNTLERLTSSKLRELKRIKRQNSPVNSIKERRENSTKVVGLEKRDENIRGSLNKEVRGLKLTAVRGLL